MKRTIFKSLCLITAKYSCVFLICRWLTREHLRILTYHGAALEDEADFRGGVFMSAARFEERLAFLKRKGYPVLGLDDAISQLPEGTLPSYATVLTIDDGWYGTASIMAPLLKQYSFPATLYVASYYMEKQTQVFNVVVDYVLWKSTHDQIDLADVHPELKGCYNISDEHSRTAATQLLWKFADSLGSASERQQLLSQVCELIRFDLQALVDKRMFSYMTAAEAADMHNFGVDLQLHTHRHRFHGESRESIMQDLEDNKRALEKLTDKPLVHFCFPSGEYDPEQITYLKKAGLRSATTTHLGFNQSDTPMFELYRFMDAEEIGTLEFEAEMAGFFEIIRWIRRR